MASPTEELNERLGEAMTPAMRDALVVLVRETMEPKYLRGAWICPLCEMAQEPAIGAPQPLVREHFGSCPVPAFLRAAGVGA